MLYIQQTKFHLIYKLGTHVHLSLNKSKAIKKNHLVAC